MTAATQNENRSINHNVKEEEMMECKTRSKIRIQSTLSIKSQNIVKRTTVVPKHTLTTKLKLKFCASPTNNHQFYIIINGHGQSRVKWIWNTGGNRMAKHNVYLAANKNWCINTLATREPYIMSLTSQYHGITVTVSFCHWCPITWEKFSEMAFSAPGWNGSEGIVHLMATITQGKQKLKARAGVGCWIVM